MFFWYSFAEEPEIKLPTYVEYIMRNARLAEAQARIKIAGRNINNLRCVDDIILMSESKEELKNN